jgi:hypothetical protein
MRTKSACHPRSTRLVIGSVIDSRCALQVRLVEGRHSVGGFAAFRREGRVGRRQPSLTGLPAIARRRRKTKGLLREDR